MSRAFSAPTDRIVAPAPAAWPGQFGTIFMNVKPNGWGPGIGGDHVFWVYGYRGAAGPFSFIGFERFSDYKVYVGWRGDAGNGGEQRIVIPDAGCFADGVWSKHVFTWDDASDREDYYVDGSLRGSRSMPLATQTLSGHPSSNITIGNHNAAFANADARSSLGVLARWDRVLSADERSQLQIGTHPLDLPTGLVECVELGTNTPELDLQSAVTYLVTGTTVEPGPSRLPAEIRRLAKQFEPILMFHPAETFFPIDPKWYLEQSALWPAVPNFTDKANWGEIPSSPFPHGPRLARQKIAALAGETIGGSRWLGTSGAEFGVDTAPDGEAPPRQKEFFFDFAGWEPVMDPASAVTATSVNRHPAVDAAEYAGPLATSRPWYYVEYLDNDDLNAFTETRKPMGLDLRRLVAQNPSLNRPRALLYYFLYPLHQEPLEDCETAGEGQLFGTYAGEWACVAVLLDGGGAPQFIGLTSRNVGKPSLVGTEDVRVGMTVLPWTAVDTVPGPAGGVHPKIFVSLGTHGYYVSAGPHIVTPFSGGNDITRGSCGEVETADEVISGDIVIPGQPSDMVDGWILAVKFGIPLILIAWGLVEISNEHFGSADTLVTPSQTPSDKTGGPTFGKILRPAGLNFPEVASATAVDDWQVNRLKAADGRVYDYLVSRAAQVWWTPRRRTASPLEGPGWIGRWGPRVTNDPFNRRAGGKCPDFTAMFLEALGIAFNI